MNREDLAAAWAHAGLYVYIAAALVNLVALFLPWDWFTLVNALAFLLCANWMRESLVSRGWRGQIRGIPDKCGDCGCRSWLAWLKPSFTRFPDTPIQTIWAWAFWCGPFHVRRQWPEEGLQMRFALYRKSDPKNHTFVPCANNDGRDGHNWTCEVLCVHCGRPASFHI